MLRRMSPLRPVAPALLPLLLCLAAAPLARAESGLRLPAPRQYGDVPAVTYDEGGQPVGRSALRLERRGGSRVRLEAEAGIEGAEQSTLTAELAEVDGGSALRLLSQRSQSVDAAGRSLGVMTIDHERRLASCAPPPDEGGEVQTLELPDPDRVANVPMNLLFLPLASGEEERIEFQFLLCRGGPRLVDASASVAQTHDSPNGNGERIVEVKYELDFGPILSRVAAPFMPRLSIWFDSGDRASWLAHTQPLFAKGPTVWVVRSGIAPEALEGKLPPPTRDAAP